MERKEPFEDRRRAQRAGGVWTPSQIPRCSASSCSGEKVQGVPCNGDKVQGVPCNGEKVQGGSLHADTSRGNVQH